MKVNSFQINFNDIFQSFELRKEFVTHVLEAFAKFPPDTRLNCDDFYSILSVINDQIPYSFVAFVCECVDPTISSGTLISHRIAFGNFLLALPCCLFFPQFMYHFLTYFKTLDKLKKGVLPRSTLITILTNTFYSFYDKQTKTKSDENELGSSLGEEEEEEESLVLNTDPQKIPSLSLIDEFKKATTDLDEASVQTLFFIMWQKEPILLECKSNVQH